MLRKIQILKGYGIFGGLRLCVDVLVSMIMFGRGVLIRRPFYIKKYGTIKFGKGFSSGPGFICDALLPESKIEIGANVKINHNVHIGCIDHVKLGDDVLIASGVYISDHSHGSFKGLDQSDPRLPPNNHALSFSNIHIEDRVWIGERVTILPGVRIGEGAILGAGCIVSNDVEAFTIVVGIPAKAIKKYNMEKNMWEAVH